MELTLAERMMLVNQHEILGILETDPMNKEYHQRAVRVFSNGFKGFYEEYSVEREEEIAVEILAETRNILRMFIFIKKATNRLEANSEIDPALLEFNGFDRNGSGHFAMCCFLKTVGEYNEFDLDQDCNEEFSLSSYKRMLDTYYDSDDPTILTKDDLIRISQARYTN